MAARAIQRDLFQASCQLRRIVGEKGTTRTLRAPTPAAPSRRGERDTEGTAWRGPDLVPGTVLSRK